MWNIKQCFSNSFPLIFSFSHWEPPETLPSSLLPSSDQVIGENSSEWPTVQPAVHGWVEDLRWDPCPGGGRGGGDGETHSLLTGCPPGGGFWVRSYFWPWQRRLWQGHRWELLKSQRLNLKVRNMSDGRHVPYTMIIPSWGNLNTSLVTRKQMLLYCLIAIKTITFYTAAPMCENILFLLGEVLGKLGIWVKQNITKRNFLW